MEALNPYWCLSNQDFQDWLAKVRILVPQPTSLSDLEMTINTWKNGGSNMSERLLTTLAQRPHRLVPKDELAWELYESDEPQRLQNVSNWGGYIQQHLQHPEVLLQARGLGWGLGVKKFRLNPQTLPMVYFLWDRLGEFGRIGKLAEATYGVDDLSTRRMVVRHMQNLRLKVLPDTDARIEPQGSMSDDKLTSGGLAYRLISISDTKPHQEVEAEDYLPSYLRFHFQDFLAREDVGLLQRRPSSVGLKLGRELTSLEQTLLYTLREYPGFVLPFSYVSTEMYGIWFSQTRVQSVLQSCREKLIDSQAIYAARDLGIGVGIEHLKLSRLPLQVLHILWRGNEKPVMAHTLLKHVYSSPTFSNLRKIERIIHEINDSLSDSAFGVASHSIGIRGGNEYRLASK